MDLYTRQGGQVNGKSGPHKGNLDIYSFMQGNMHREKSKPLVDLGKMSFAAEQDSQYIEIMD